MCERPALTPFTFSAEASMPMTRWPASASAHARGSPTYPSPTTAIVALRSLSFLTRASLGPPMSAIDLNSRLDGDRVWVDSQEPDPGRDERQANRECQPGLRRPAFDGHAPTCGSGKRPHKGGGKNLIGRPAEEPEPMREMILAAKLHRAAGRQPRHDHERGVEDGKRHGKGEYHQGVETLRAVCGPNRARGHAETDHAAARVTHENLGSRAVDHEKSDRRTGERQGPAPPSRHDDRQGKKRARCRRGRPAGPVVAP